MEGDRCRVVVVAGAETDDLVGTAGRLVDQVRRGVGQVLADLDHVPGALRAGFDEFAAVVDRLGVGHHHAAQAVRGAAQGRRTGDAEAGGAAGTCDTGDQLVGGAGAADVVQVVKAVATEVAGTIAAQHVGLGRVQTAIDAQVHPGRDRHVDGRHRTIVECDVVHAIGTATPGQPQHGVAVRAAATGGVGGGPGQRRHRQRQQGQQAGPQPAVGSPCPGTFSGMNASTARAFARRRRRPHG
ncbi:hypothetical protein G6F24_015050 [Rhizopus arrhizus]|nr:hypothetical protein G6F24_015050 [Rhizopus arrhizus]